MKIKMQDAIYYAVIFAISIGLMNWFKSAQDDILKLFLYPHARVTEIFYNISMRYIYGVGYSAVGNSFTIGRECMGMNFILMIFCMTSCVIIREIKGLYKAIFVLVSFLGAVIIGIIVSCIRIIASVPFVSNEKFALIHSILGISLYLFVAICIYAIVKKYVRSDNCEQNC